MVLFVFKFIGVWVIGFGLGWFSCVVIVCGLLCVGCFLSGLLFCGWNI